MPVPSVANPGFSPILWANLDRIFTGNLQAQIMLRVYGNRALKTLPGLETRPTTARVRQAVFNIWQGRIQGCRWLDLCAGCGSMGAEALGRGAAEVVGVEQGVAACAVVRQNWQKLAQPEQRVRIFRGDVLNQLSRFKGQPFDLIYFDPPYSSSLYPPVLSQIAQLGLLQAGGEVAVEHGPQGWQPGESIPGLRLIRQKRYGLTHLAFYTFDQSHNLIE
jgi:16S rRNA (guanine(966)-N(2))-methyltransferase RsmD